MGYTTEFSGSFDLNKQLTPEHQAYLTRFAKTRRMKRKPTFTAKMPDSLRLAVALPIGSEGAYFVGDGADYGQSSTPDIADFNSPPAGQPGLWCQWIPTDDGLGIEWDGGEKFYDYVEWIKYLVEHFIAPWGYKLNGEVTWEGEDSGDLGKIVIKNNVVTVKKGTITYS